MTNAYGKSVMIPTESETTCTVGNLSHGSRETPATSNSSMELERSEKARRHNPDMHVAGESDGSIVPEKLANKTGTPVTELVEERGHPRTKSCHAHSFRSQYRAKRIKVHAQLRQVKMVTSRPLQPKGRAVCGSSARTDLRGGGQQWPSPPRKCT